MPQRLQTALQLHENGQLAEAERIYRDILRKDPRHDGALNLMGALSQQTGHSETAAKLILKAIEVNPANAIYHLNLGSTYRSLKQLEQAEASLNRALELQPGWALALSNLGAIREDQSRYEEAAALQRQAVAAEPNLAQAHINLGRALNRLAKYTEAIGYLETGIRLQGPHPELYFDLGNALRGCGRYEEALGAYDITLKTLPNHLEAMANRAYTLWDMGRHDDAVAGFRRTLEINPDHADNNINLGNVLAAMGDLGAARDCYENAIRIDPDYFLAYTNLGNTFREQGRIGDAVIQYRRASDLCDQRPEIHSNLIYGLLTDPDTPSEQTVAEARTWRDASMEAGYAAGHALAVTADAEKTLRIGYVSSDLRNHSVGIFMEAVITGKRPDNTEVYCYAGAANQDGYVERLRGGADHWREVHALGPDDLAALIRKDRIDILVDLAGHTSNNFLPLFARKPAPIQVAYLGYPGTTGLSAMDYRLTDQVADPQGMTEHCFSETLVRLPHGFLCYTPRADSPKPAPPPSRKNGYVTFGSFNNLVKFTPRVAALWSRILGAVENAHLLLKSKSFACEETRNLFFDSFANHGIDRDRIELVAFVKDSRDHLDTYARVDIALDPFPYNGTTTTCEALWMGVPVISMAGDTHMGRVGASILAAAGLPDLVAADEDGYVNLATQLAGDRNRLAGYRRDMRKRMEASPLLDARQFNLDLDGAYRGLWRQWCGRAGSLAAP